MDTHEVPLFGGPDDPKISDVEALFEEAKPGSIGGPVRFLFWLRDKLGLLFGWDEGKMVSDLNPSSFFWHLSEEDKAHCFREPGQRLGPATVLWNDEYSLCLEILNATCQAFAVTYIRDRKACLAVFVVETKWWSKYYLALIEPFRKFIVYPSTVRWLEKSWKERHASADEGSSQKLR